MSNLSKIQHAWNKHQWLIIIILAGFILRVLFFLVGADFYFSRENFMLDGDSRGWMTAVENFLRTGSYFISEESYFGKFSRMPGYPLFIGIFYAISGQDWQLAIKLIVWAQIFLDSMAVGLVYSIVKRITIHHSKAPWIASLLYATYPFIIVWTPVVYAESFSVFLVLLSLFFLLRTSHTRWSLFWGGVFMGWAVLCRPQLGLLMPVSAFYFWHQKRLFIPFLRLSIIWGLGIMLSYGLWPARNLLLYGEIIFTEDLRATRTYDKDVVSFRAYVYSLKPEWEPQFSQIIQNKKVNWPDHAFINSKDSLLLIRTTQLAQNCSEGFSYWRDYHGERIKEGGCKEEVASGFQQLRRNQIEANPFNYYVKIPLQNLKKAFFKTSLTAERGGIMSYLVSGLFIYRSLLLIAGFGLGLYLLWFRKESWVIIPFFYGLLIYLILSGGPSTLFRNIEMRYFLQADAILILPAALGLDKLLSIVFRAKC